ncbi:fluoride efflux transporter FluC [Actinotalea soli]|uniref:fluoride efflux transporter FluC n=1 Tax=Actinotalea soli TaxID=2819234 RepID=UPI0027DDBE15|nr:CrcB family protein [Actinotalea soli]
MSRPHLDPRLVALVAVGGMVGTTARFLLSTSLPHTEGAWPTATFLENLVGAFLLGLLLETLVRRGAESPRGRSVRLGLGTGALGGFTTYSSLALELERLLTDGAFVIAAAYATATVVLGLAACFAGVTLAARRAGADHPTSPAPGAGPTVDGPGAVR